MRISDWSSDVCSSDLQVENLPWFLVTRYDDCVEALRKPAIFSSEHREFGPALKLIGLTPSPETHARMIEIGGDRGAMFDILQHGRAAGRGRGCQYGWI